MKVYRSHGYSSHLPSARTPSRPTPSSLSAFFSRCSLILLLHPLFLNLSSLAFPHFCHPITPHTPGFFLLNFLPQWSWKEGSLSLSPHVLFVFSFFHFLPCYQNNQVNLWLELYIKSTFVTILTWKTDEELIKNRITQQLLQLELSLVFSNICRHNNLANNLRVVFI